MMWSGEVGLLPDFPSSVCVKEVRPTDCLRSSKQLVGYATCVARSTGMIRKMRDMNERWLACDLLLFSTEPVKRI